MRISIVCPHCGHNNSWPADCFSEGQHEHMCERCITVYVATRTGDTVTTRPFAAGEYSKYPPPNRKYMPIPPLD